MRRREFISALLVGLYAGTSNNARAHTPYKQWNVYRRKHLLIGCHKDRDETYVMAKTVVGVLEQHLPKASARVARAPTVQRIASLMATDQMDVAIVKPEDAGAMAQGIDNFKPYGEIALSELLQVEDLSMVCQSDVPDRHAWLITDALIDNLPQAVINDRQSGLALHSGAKLRYAGQPMPL